MISPIHAKTFMGALSKNIKKYEEKLGEIKVLNKKSFPEFKITKDELPN